MEMLRSKSEALEDEARKKAAVQVALGTLSFSELEAVRQAYLQVEGTLEQGPVPGPGGQR